MENYDSQQFQFAKVEAVLITTSFMRYIIFVPMVLVQGYIKYKIHDEIKFTEHIGCAFYIRKIGLYFIDLSWLCDSVMKKQTYFENTGKNSKASQKFWDPQTHRRQQKVQENRLITVIKKVNSSGFNIGSKIWILPNCIQYVYQSPKCKKTYEN